MGFPTTIAGYVVVEGDAARAVRAVHELPPLSTDQWPFLPREAFAACAAQPVLSYQGRFIIHFGMCVKEVDHDLREWLDKFERFFKAAGAVEAFATLTVPYAHSGEVDGRFNYSWKRRDSDEWVFVGGPRAMI